MATATSTSVRAELPSAARELVRSFEERDLLTWASALAFQLVTAIVPFLLFGLGLLGFLNLQSAWADVARELEPHLSDAAFAVVEDTAKKILTEKQLFWVTIGGALAVWQMSGGVRAIMGGLAVIYGIDDDRSWWERIRRSIVLAVAVSALILLAVAASWLGPLAYGDLDQPLAALLFVARWGAAALLLAAAAALMLRFAPDAQPSAGWVSVGTAIIVGAWLTASILFGLYIRFVASYGSVFGNLATVVVLFAYVYISAIVFFAGAQLDAMLRRRVDGHARGH